IRFDNGAIASVQVDLVSQPGMASRVIAGDRGTLVLDGTPRIGRPKVSVLGFIQGQTDPSDKKNEVVWDDLEMPEEEGGHRFMIRDFVEAVRQDRPPFVSGEHGRRALELTNAMIFSGLTGQSVKLPLDRDAYDRLIEELIHRRREMPHLTATEAA
ncbi:MAG: hypothetical protein KY468_21060, partial [Armatimonadetes bacterium]|nr:hypothetical protein [Armatimonadota bacterium]